jgi:hypothetical protein
MFGNMKKLFGVKDQLEEEFKRYNRLHKTTFWKIEDAGTEFCMFQHAYVSIANGYTVEESVLRNLLFETAYNIDHSMSPTELIPLITRTTTTLKVIKPWADTGRIKAEIWGQDSTTILKLIKFDKGAKKLAAQVLADFYRHADAYPPQLVTKRSL